MKGKIVSVISLLVLILLMCSDIFSDIIEFFAWLFTLQYSSPDISVAGGIVVRILAFAVSFGLVGLIFNAIGLFNSKTMSFVYFVISTLIGCALSYVVWIIEDKIIIIVVIFGIILSLVLGCFITMWIVGKCIRKENKEELEWER